MELLAGDPEPSGRLADRQSQRRENVFAHHLARMDRGTPGWAFDVVSGHANHLPSVVLLKIDLCDFIARPFERDAPRAVDVNAVALR